MSFVTDLICLLFSFAMFGAVLTLLAWITGRTDRAARVRRLHEGTSERDARRNHPSARQREAR